MRPHAIAVRITHDLAVACSWLALAMACSTPPSEIAEAPDSGPVVPVGPLPEPSDKLSETGLYADISTFTTAADAHEFAPGHVLWSDGLDKRRWIRIPRGTVIDVSDMDSWRLPIGSQLFKEFSQEGRRLETRLIYKIDDDQFWMGSYIWNEAGTEAEFAVNGRRNVLGTDHDVPSTLRCKVCHDGEAGRALGFTAVQLAQPESQLGLDTLSRDGWLSDPAPPASDLALPAADAAALGYLHANCGSCHNPNGRGWRRSDMDTRIRVSGGQLDVSMIYDSLIMAELDYWQSPSYAYRVVPGSPEESAIYHRMQQRDSDDAMPPHSTEIVDADGTTSIRDWITSLAP